MDEMDIMTLILGLDANARDEVSTSMNAIAEQGDTSNPDGLVLMLREVLALLRGVERSWTHAGSAHAQRLAPEEAEARFVSIADGARGRFDAELIRNAHGNVVRQPSPDLPVSDAPGVVVVTLVVATHRHLSPLPPENDAARLSLALDRLVGLAASDLVALEVVWSPSDPRDRIPAAEMEAMYPELTALRPAQV